MINEIKQVIQNYLSDIAFCSFMTGTVTDDGIKINEKIVIPNDIVSGNLKNSIAPGDRVRLLRNHGGQQFFILEVIEDDT